MKHSAFEVKILVMLMLTASVSACSDSSFTGSGRDISYNARGEDAADSDNDADQKNAGRKGGKDGKGGRDGADGSDSDDPNALGTTEDDGEGGTDSDGDDAKKGKGALGEDEDGLALTDVAFDSYNLCSSDNGTEVVGTNLSQQTKLVAKLYPVGGGSPTEVDVDGTLLHQAIVSGGQFEAKLPIEDGTYNLVLCAPSQKAECHFERSPSDVNAKDVEDYFEDHGGSQKAVAIAERPFSIKDGQVDGAQPRLWTLVSTKQEDDPVYCSEDNGTGKNSSPLIVDFGGKGLDLSSPEAGVAFDVHGDGWFHQISWPRTAMNAFLALDKNGDGVIDSGNELFGDHSVGPDGKRSANGFLALAKYDTNGDGWLDAKDRVFQDLRLWTDLNRNGKSDSGELRSLGAAHVKKFALAYKTRLATDRFGNEVRERSFAVLDSGSKLPVYDLWFRISEPGLTVFESFVQWIKSLV